jgi:hypothetical protein
MDPMAQEMLDEVSRRVSVASDVYAATADGTKAAHEAMARWLGLLEAYVALSKIANPRQNKEVSHAA